MFYILLYIHLVCWSHCFFRFYIFITISFSAYTHTHFPHLNLLNSKFIYTPHTYNHTHNSCEFNWIEMKKKKTNIKKRVSTIVLLLHTFECCFVCMFVYQCVSWFFLFVWLYSTSCCFSAQIYKNRKKK